MEATLRREPGASKSLCNLATLNSLVAEQFSVDQSMRLSQGSGVLKCLSFDFVILKP